VSAFVSNASPENYDGKIPTALVLTGPNIAAHGPLFAQFATRIRDADRTGPVVLLTSKDAANLKGALKKLIKDATQQDEGMDDEDEEAILGRKGAKLLNYDLQILQNWCALHEGQKVVVAIQDTEAFDSGILADLVELFSSYLDRIPFVLLLGIATSLDIFHDKLPKATIRKMQGDKFDVERAEECLAQVFNDAVLGSKSVLRLGPSVCDQLIGRQKNHTQSIQTFVAALKYAYMSHFYANPLSIILGFFQKPDKLMEVLSDEHIQAIRNLPSFRKY
jgi:origin recognition complex subunit 3